MTQTNEQLDRFLAEMIGWHDNGMGMWVDEKSRPRMYTSKKYIKYDEGASVWHPTADIAQAVECAEKWCDDAGGHYNLDGGFDGNGEFVYRAVLTKWNPRSQSHKRYAGEGTKELAICLALYESKKGGE